MNFGQYLPQPPANQGMQSLSCCFPLILTLPFKLKTLIWQNHFARCKQFLQVNFFSLFKANWCLKLWISKPLAVLILGLNSLVKCKFAARAFFSKLPYLTHIICFGE
jgi:hypothetical protein